MVQFITHYTDCYDYLDSVRLALEGGCRWIQLRMKGADDGLLLKTAIQAQKMCREYGATFIIDDNVAVAKQIAADGVHLGKDDMPIAEARAILGSDVIIGGTANSFEDILAHARAGVNYIGCGPFRFTTTKQKLSPILGIDGYRKIVEQMESNGIELPIVAIGGITYDDIPAIMDVGVSGIALSGSILRAENPQEEMLKTIKLVEQWRS